MQIVILQGTLINSVISTYRHYFEIILVQYVSKINRVKIMLLKLTHKNSQFRD